MGGIYKLVSARKKSAGRDFIVTVLFENEKPIELYIDDAEQKYRAGDIFVGHVINIDETSGGAFVKFTPDETGFLPKESFSGAVFKNSKKDGILKAEDELLVSIETEALKTKNPVLSTELKITGINFIISNRIDGLLFSKKLTKDDKGRITGVLQPYLSEYGFIVRTSAAYAAEEELIIEIRELSCRMEKLIKNGRMRNYGVRLYDSGGIWLEKLRQYGIDSFERIITDDEEIYRELYSFASEHHIFPVLKKPILIRIKPCAFIGMKC